MMGEWGSGGWVTEPRELQRQIENLASDYDLLVRLVVRMGHAVSWLWYDNGAPVKLGEHIDTRYPYTPAGQRQYDAAAKILREAEGKPEGHELVEDIQ